MVFLIGPGNLEYSAIGLGQFEDEKDARGFWRQVSRTVLEAAGAKMTESKIVCSSVSFLAVGSVAMWRAVRVVQLRLAATRQRLRLDRRASNYTVPKLASPRRGRRLNSFCPPSASGYVGDF
jgi:hypothetical protein